MANNYYFPRFLLPTALVFLAAMSNCGYDGNGQAIKSNMTDLAQNDRLYRLEIKKPEFYQPIDRKIQDPENYRFVETDIVAVGNPKLYPLRFEISFESAEKENTFLGTFSLFPADNPGSFIVPSQGKLEKGGRLIIKMVVPDDVGERDVLWADVREMRLRRNGK